MVEESPAALYSPRSFLTRIHFHRVVIQLLAGLKNHLVGGLRRDVENVAGMQRLLLATFDAGPPDFMG